jgi:FlaA1/EpsC-like NDP-sugar epimerase
MVKVVFRKPHTLRFVGALFDVMCAAIAVPLAYTVRLGNVPDFSGPVAVMQLSFVSAALASFFAFGLNRGSWRYASIDDLLAIIKAVIAAMLFAVLTTFLISRLDMVPRTVPFIAMVALVVMMGGARFCYRVFKDRYLHGGFIERVPGEPVLLLGYTNEAESFVRAMARQKRPQYSVVGIIDHSDNHSGRRLHRVNVLGTLSELSEVVVRLRNDGLELRKLVICPSRASVESTEKIIELAADLGMQVYMLPNSDDLVASSDVKGIAPQAIQLEDLLGRAPAKIDLSPVAVILKNKTVLVTGGGGSIGSELVMQIASWEPREIIIIDSSEFNLYSIEQRLLETVPQAKIRAILADVRDRKRVSDIMARFEPELVFHAAALKHVPLVEENIIEGARTNILGTVNVADAAFAHKAMAFVLISTDKAVNPTNIMGATKRFAEAYCQSLDLELGGMTRFMTVRFGNVLGSAGSVVPLFARQIAKGGPITVTHPDITRFFMSMREAVKLVLSASARGMDVLDGRGKIMVLDMGKPVKITDLANRMIQLAGLRPNTDIKVVFTGLRAGEKLHEQRLEANEPIVSTSGDWLHIASPRQINKSALDRALANLAAGCEHDHQAQVVSAIKDVVPELSWSRNNASGTGLIESADAPISLSEARKRLNKD